MHLPIEAILDPTDYEPPPIGQVIGQSRTGTDIHGHILGHGPMHISLIGGCHADEPVGPAMLLHLVGFLSQISADDPLIGQARWLVVPHVNPDGAIRNSKWIDRPVETYDSCGKSDFAYDPLTYVESVARELPGDDIEFGFPRDKNDQKARPENRAVANFLSGGAPYDLHASFHGMGFAPGPWFLLEPSWIDRTVDMRENLRARVQRMRLPLFDIDRKGDKGFSRIDEGFSTRPDSRAMARHFIERGDPKMAEKFRPSSMEFICSLGGDPLTLVSEMPLFLLESSPSDPAAPKFRPGTEGKNQVHSLIQAQIASQGPEEARRLASPPGIRAMPIRDQMRLQLAFLNEALDVVSQERSGRHQ
jgi:hypothetical protein